MGKNYKTKDGQIAKYLATPPTMTDGDGGALMVDVNGRLKVNVVAGGGGGGGALGPTPMVMWPLQIETRSSFVTHVLDAPGEKLALVFQANKVGTITKIGFIVNTVTAAGDFDVRLETVDATNGNPTGTLATTNANASVNISAAGYVEVTLTVGHVVAKGATLAAVVTSTNTGNIAIRAIDSFRPMGLPYINHFTTSWSKANRIPSYAIGYSDGSYPHLTRLLPALTANELNYNTTSSPDEVGNYFTAPFKMRVCGVWVSHLRQDCEAVLYDSTNTVIATATLDKDVNINNSEAYVYLYFTDSVVLDKSSSYRLVAKPTTTTSVGIQIYDFPNANVKESAGFAGISKTTRTDAGSWTEDATDVVHMGLLIDQLAG